MGVPLKTELPYIHIVSKRHLDTTCSFCFRVCRDKTLKHCANCLSIWYCDAGCQRADWEDHKHECKLMKDPAKRRDFTQFARAMVRIIEKRKKYPDFKSSNGVTFDTIAPMEQGEPYCPEAVTNGFDKTLECLYGIVGETNLPPRSELFMIYFTFAVHSFAITNYEELELGYGLYLGMTRLLHSCYPDTYYVYDGRKLVLRALKEGVTAYNDNLTLSYCCPVQRTVVRQKFLGEYFNIHCECTVCKDVEREKLASSYRCLQCKGDGRCLLDVNEFAPCTVCNKVPHTITAEEAQAVLKQAERFVELMSRSGDETREPSREGDEAIAPALSYYQQLEMSCTAVNVPRMQVATTISKWYLAEKNFQFAAEFAEKTLPCLECFLPTGHPLLSERYLNAGLLFGKNPANFDRAAEYLIKAIELLKVSHGVEHISVIVAAEQYAKLREQRALRRGREELMRVVHQ